MHDAPVVSELELGGESRPPIIHPPQGRTARPPVLLRAPLAAVAAAMMTGLVLGRYLPLPSGFWGAAAVAALLTALALSSRRHLRAAASLALGVAIIATSALHLRYACFTLEGDHIATATGEHAVLASLRGRVASMPQTHAASSRPGRPAARTSFLLEVREVLSSAPDHSPATASRSAASLPRRWERASGLVRVSILEVEDRLQPGMDVEIMGWLGRLAGPDNPGQTDWAQLARRHGVHARLSVESPEAIALLKVERPWYQRAIWQVRSAFREHLWACGGLEQGPLLGALIAGERQPALRQLNRMMVRAGTAHFLSISGMHLAIFLGFVYALCRLVSLTPRRSAWAVLIVLGAYVALAEPNPPLLRSALMAGCLCLGAILRRPYTSLNALSAAAVFLLALDPMQLFSPGFQLSFAIVAALILLHRAIRRRLFGRFLRRRGLVVFRQGDWLGRFLHYRAADAGIALATVSLAAWAASMPLVAVHFGLFSPYAPVLSILLTPLVAAVLVPGYLAAALAPLAPNLGYALGRVSAMAADWLTAAVNAGDHLPGLSFSLYPLSAWVVVLWFAALGLLVWAWRWRLGRIALAGVTLLLAGLTAASQAPAAPPGGLELHLLDVGAGQCAVLRTPTGRTILIDAGSQAGQDGQELIPPFLRERRLGRVEAAFVSHANADHFNALPGEPGWMGPGWLYLNPWMGLGGDEPSEAGALLREMDHLGWRTQRLAAGRTFPLDDQTTVEVLWPPLQPRDLAINDTSLVLRVSAGGRSILLPGDVEAHGQSALAKLGDRLRSDVLVLPHHGGWRKTLPEFVAAVQPKVILVSAGRDPQGTGKDADASRVFYRSIKTPGRYFCTARSGWICVRLRGEFEEVETMRRGEQGTGNRE